EAPRRAAEGAARWRPRPQQDRRPRERFRVVLRPRDRPARQAARSARSRRGPRAARGNAHRAPPTIRRLTARWPPVAAPLRRPPHRLARPRPRLGDRRPFREGVTVLAERPCYAILLSKDLDASRAFYHDVLGLE